MTRQQVGARLGRHIANLVPASGNPKLDVLARLADELDWSVGEVVRAIWPAMGSEESGEQPGALSPEARAEALRLEAVEAAASGHFEHAIRCLRRGLRPHPLARESRRRLEIELAASFIATWSVVPGVALVDRLLHWYGK
ncbi:MAG: hypothetical protein KDA21_09645, partial [Phycisphaerales bacterium]|nr:hypothetical protein [Phycisphaerales bacterium]